MVHNTFEDEFENLLAKHLVASSLEKSLQIKRQSSAQCQVISIENKSLVIQIERRKIVDLLSSRRKMSDRSCFVSSLASF